MRLHSTRGGNEVLHGGEALLEHGIVVLDPTIGAGDGNGWRTTGHRVVIPQAVPGGHLVAAHLLFHDLHGRLLIAVAGGVAALAVSVLPNPDRLACLPMVAQDSLHRVD